MSDDFRTDHIKADANGYGGARDQPANPDNAAQALEAANSEIAKQVALASDQLWQPGNATALARGRVEASTYKAVPAGNNQTNSLPNGTANRPGDGIVYEPGGRVRRA
jgi:hypothetical protein